VVFVKAAFACSALSPLDLLGAYCSLVEAGVADIRKRHRHYKLGLCVEVTWMAVENEVVESYFVVVVVVV